MNRGRRPARAHLLCGVAISAVISMSGVAQAQDAGPISIPSQSLATALNSFGVQTGRAVMFKPELAAGKQSGSVDSAADPELALNELLSGTGLSWRRDGDLFLIDKVNADPQSGSAAGDGADGTVEALIVTAQKREEDIQDVPIAISAFTQEALERSQVAGGPDLMTQVPNMTFTKTNFTGYSIQLRGVGTQAISATTDAAVAVAFNNTPFIRNRFFEQEFYDLQRVEVLRGPQGTLYGRNATAGVVNLISQKPKFAYEAKVVGDISNYSSTRLEGMVNVPLVDDKVALRLAGAWTKREGFVTNAITGNPIDGRDLWSTRLSLRFAPIDALDVNLIWEHFEEKDDRLRSGKQLCHQDDRETINGKTVSWGGYNDMFSQGCIAASLYSPDSLEAPNGYSLPYYLPLSNLGLPVKEGFNPYASLVQSPDLRVIESTVDPKYVAKSDLVELQWSYDISDSLTLTSETSYNYDTIFSSEDYNRFNTAAGAFAATGLFQHRQYMQIDEDGVPFFCDPQLGCANRVVAVDASRAKSSQFSQEFRLSSDYEGSFNFSLGANYLRYDTEDKYYVFINTLTMFAASGPYQFFADLSPWQPGVSDNRECFTAGLIPPDPASPEVISGCIYIDPNPIESVNDLGHNYFLSRNPYKLISYALFGEAYWNITDNLKLTAGLRVTRDEKQAPRIPSWLLGSNTVGLSVLTVEEQEWTEPTGRLTLDWKPDLGFTDETLLYASYSHGYKAGGSNPPPAGVTAWGLSGLGGDDTLEGILLTEKSALKPKTFDPEFVDAFEIGAKNTFADGKATLNLAAFYYDYTGYQVSQIIDRSAINYNFDAKIWGVEVEADWRPLENLRFGFKGGYENTEIADGEQAIDIMDRTNGDPDWMVIRPFPSFPSNCVLPTASIDPDGDGVTNVLGFGGGFMGPCEFAYLYGQDPVTQQVYPDTNAPTSPPMPDTFPNYDGYNPLHDVGQNNGEGFFKQLGGNELPNAPHFTGTITADYTIPLPNDWLATLHTDLYYQSEAWTRVFNTEGYDKLKAYTNVNVAAIFTNETAGWKVMAYVKNVFDRDSITGAFLNSDDTGLTTNVFLTEPRLYGLRVTKDFDGGPWWTGAHGVGPYSLWVELAGTVMRQDAPYASVSPEFVDEFSTVTDPTQVQHRDLDWGDGRQVSVTYKPTGGSFSFKAAARYGRTNSGVTRLHTSEAAGPRRCPFPPDTFLFTLCAPGGPAYYITTTGKNWSDASAREQEDHVIVDFMVGKDLGLGGLSSSTISAGLRYLELNSSTAASMDGIPNLHLEDGFVGASITTYNLFRASILADREFQGFGPELSWEASQDLVGDDDIGHLGVEWSLAGGVLFGRQETGISGSQQSLYVATNVYQLVGSGFPVLPNEPLGVASRSKDTSVPFVDLSLGLSYDIQRVKIGAGYRWERYFDVIDAGYSERQEFDRTIDGPYFKFSVGFGG